MQFLDDPNAEKKIKKKKRDRTYASGMCSYCNKYFKNLSDHKLVAHSRNKPWTCDLCSVNFVYKSLLNTHQRRKHFKCIPCKTTFNDLKSILQHEKENHGVKCTYCERVESKARLNKHVEICLKKPIIVESKSKDYVPKINSRWIDSPRPFNCIVCKLKFTNKHVCLNHIKEQHLKEEPNKCKKCCLAFSNIADFGQHVLAIHKDMVEIGKSNTYFRLSSLDGAYSKVQKPSVLRSHLILFFSNPSGNPFKRVFTLLCYRKF